MKKTIIFAAALVILAACSDNKQKYSFSGTVEIPNMNGKNIIVEEIVDGIMVASDTLTITNNSFSLTAKMDGPAVRTGFIEGSLIKPFEVVFEEGPIQVVINKDSTITVSGTPLNEKLQKRYEENRKFEEVVVGVKEEMDEAVANGTITPERQEEYGKEFRTLIDANTEQLVSFIKENVNNPLGEYYFYKSYLLMPQERKTEMLDFAPDKIRVKYGLPATGTDKPAENK